jgi:hypothetical protein
LDWCCHGIIARLCGESCGDVFSVDALAGILMFCAYFIIVVHFFFVVYFIFAFIFT